MIYLACFVAGAVLAIVVLAVVYVRARRKDLSILSLIHGDVSKALGRIEEKVEGLKQ